MDDPQVQDFGHKIKMARIISRLMCYKLCDLQDYTAFKKNVFTRRNQKFNLFDCFSELKEIMGHKASIKQIDFHFDFMSQEKK